MKEKIVKVPMSKNKKRLIAILVSVAVVLVALITALIVFSVLDHRPPALETVRPRIEELVEQSYEVNELLWGEGLPTHPRVYKQNAKTFTIRCKGQESMAYYYVIDDATHGEVVVYQYWLRYVPEGTQQYTYLDVEKGGVIMTNVGQMEDKDMWRCATRSKEAVAGQTPIYVAEESGYYYYRLEGYAFTDGIYDDENDPESGYDYVDMAACDYYGVDELLHKAEHIFSSSYLSAVSEGLFEGFTTPAGYVSGARYRDFDDPDDTETSTVLIKSNQYEPLIKARRLYNFDTMTVHKDSNSTFLKIEVDSYLEGDEGNVLRIYLYFTLENGQWMLDGPTY